MKDNISFNVIDFIPYGKKNAISNEELAIRIASAEAALKPVEDFINNFSE